MKEMTGAGSGKRQSSSMPLRTHLSHGWPPKHFFLAFLHSWQARFLLFSDLSCALEPFSFFVRIVSVSICPSVRLSLFAPS